MLWIRVGSHCAALLQTRHDFADMSSGDELAHLMAIGRNTLQKIGPLQVGDSLPRKA
jgi:hypothetical protein